MKILIVDDAPDIREILEIVLGQDGWEVTTAGTVSEANLQLSKEKPDLILVDYQLPDGDGVSAARAWKAQNAGIPIVLYTGSEGQKGDPALASVIVKTIDPFELSQRLKAL